MTTKNKSGIAIPTLEEMLEAGVHFGHQTSKKHPKMDEYIFTMRNKVHIMNLEATREMLTAAAEFLRGVAEKNGMVLFVGTKKQAQGLVQTYATAVGMPYVNLRWLGGTFTNFGVVKGLIRKFKELKKKREKGELEKYTKKERKDFDDEIGRLEKLVGGIEVLEKLPSAVFIVDPKNDTTALREAIRMKVPVIAISDTNNNPEEIDYPIAGNDDAPSSIELILKTLAEAVKTGKGEAKPDDTRINTNDTNNH